MANGNDATAFVAMWTREHKIIIYLAATSSSIGRRWCLFCMRRRIATQHSIAIATRCVGTYSSSWKKAANVFVRLLCSFLSLFHFVRLSLRTTSFSIVADPYTHVSLWVWVNVWPGHHISYLPSEMMNVFVRFVQQTLIKRRANYLLLGDSVDAYRSDSFLAVRNWCSELSKCFTSFQHVIRLSSS